MILRKGEAVVAKGFEAMTMRHVWILILMLTSCATLAAVDEKSDRNDTYSVRQIQDLEKFVATLGDLFTLAQVHDPEIVRTTLNVVLSKRATSTDAYSGYLVTNLPAHIASIKYATRRLENGMFLGDLYVAFKNEGVCLSIEKLRSLTKLDFERKPIIWHSDDRRKSGVIDRYLVAKLDARARHVILSARFNTLRCVTSIALVGR